VWVRNLVSRVKGRTQIKGVLEQGADDNIWTQRDEVRDWRQLHNEELRNLYSSPSIVGTIKSRRIRWAGHVAGMEI
jgi:hypothetical protein